MRDIMNIAVVNFAAVWGDKQANLKKIKEYSEAAGKRGADMVVFPETCLSGYDDESEKIRSEKMHVLVAETIPGPSTNVIAEVAKKYGMYVVFGMPEKDGDDPSKIYNSAAIIYPDGKADTYRKLHLPFSEGNWAVCGDKPVMIDTPWGPVGITICYDSYCFPELIRYYRAKGARLCLNVTACPINSCTRTAAEMTIPAYVYTNYVYIASANLVGRDKNSYFIGGSSVIGPDVSKEGACGAHVFLGKMFNSPGSDKPEMFLGTIDLASAELNTDIPIFRKNPVTGRADWRPELYERLCKDVQKG